MWHKRGCTFIARTGKLALAGDLSRRFRRPGRVCYALAKFAASVDNYWIGDVINPSRNRKRISGGYGEMTTPPQIPGGWNPNPGAGPNLPWPPYVSQQIPQAPGKGNNILGLIALIVAVIGFIFACIPGVLIVGWVLLPIAFILGIVGMFQAGKAKQTSIAAITLSIVGGVVGASIFAYIVFDSFRDTFGSTDLKPSPSITGSEASKIDPSRENSSSSAEPGTRQNPLPIGQTVTNKDWEITLGTPREAGAEVAAENQFNARPETGREFWIVPVTAIYIGDESSSVMFGVRVEFVGSDNRTYNDYCGVIPDSLNDIGVLYKNGVAKGNVCVAVPAGADGLWTVSTDFGTPVFFNVK